MNLIIFDLLNIVIKSKTFPERTINNLINFNLYSFSFEKDDFDRIKL